MIEIEKTDKCDTRVPNVVFTKTDVEEDTLKHIDAVKKISQYFCDELMRRVEKHDYTKLGKYLDLYTEALNSHTIGDEFYKQPWWKIHESQERHHLEQKVPEDVDLWDYLEMVIDRIAAGMARTGKVFPVQLDMNVVKEATENTIDKISKEIKIIK